MCDGGNKIKEFEIFSTLLKKDDVIMAHDFSYDLDYYNQHMRKIWKNIKKLEISDSDIKQICNDYDLIPYKEKMTVDVLWCSRIKH